MPPSFHINIPTLCAPVLICCALSCAAQPMQMLTTDELNEELLGAHLFGYLMGSDLAFDECIEPEGETVYRVAPGSENIGYSEIGKIVVTPLAQACFSYPPENDSEPSCFRVFRYKDGYVFNSVTGKIRFIVTEVVRGIERCPDPGAFTS